MMTIKCRFLFLLLGLALLGCQRNETLQPALIELIPPVLDSGDVRMNENPLHLSFSVKNSADVPVQIEAIDSSCGCTVADVPDKMIPPHQQVAVPVTVSISGRSGEFNHQLFVRIAGLTSSFPLEIKGHVLNDLRCLPSVIRLTTDSQTGLAQGYFEIYTDKHHDIQFNFDDTPEHFKVHEVSRRRLAGETVIRLSLAIEAELPSYRLTLQPTDSTIAPLTVSIQCLTAE
jgi:hypothetical protein